MYNEAVFDLLVPPNEGHEKLQIVRLGKETVVQVSNYIFTIKIYIRDIIRESVDGMAWICVVMLT